MCDSRVLSSLVTVSGGRSVSRLITSNLGGGKLLTGRGDRVKGRVVGSVCQRTRLDCRCIIIYSTLRTAPVPFLPLGNSILRK